MKRLLAAVLATTVLAACGGGGGGSSVPGTSKTQAKTATATVVISIPVASTTTQALTRNVKFPQFVSPNASSVAMNVNGGSDQFFDVSATSNLCTTTASVRNCTLSFGAPAGTDTFGFLVFSGPSGSGTTLASGTSTPQTLVSGQAFNFTVALNAVIGTVVGNVVGASQGNCTGISQAPNSQVINEGCPGGAVLSVTVMDPSGAVVTGTAQYGQTISISTSDPSLAASPTTITTPGQTSTLTYNGAAFAAAVTTSATFNLTVGTTAVIPITVPVRRSYLYVANSNAPYGSPPTGGGNVAVYTFGASGAAAPIRVLTGLTTPVKAISDPSGNAYVLDNGTGPSFSPTIFTYAPGATTPSATPRITNMGSLGIGVCTDMVFDPTGAYLFVACGTQIEVYPVGANGLASTVSTTQMTDDDEGSSVGLAFDPSGDLYFSDPSGFNAIFYVPAPLPTTGSFHMIGGPNTMQPPTSWPATLDPIYLVIDALGTLYAPFYYQNGSSGAPDTSAELGIWKSTTLPCTNCAPSATLVGAPFTTHAVTGVALDANGNVYVANSFTNLVTEFSKATVNGALVGTTGAVLRTIQNTGTGANAPLGLWVGP